MHPRDLYLAWRLTWRPHMSQLHVDVKRSTHTPRLSRSRAPNSTVHAAHAFTLLSRVILLLAPRSRRDAPSSLISTSAAESRSVGAARCHQRT